MARGGQKGLVVAIKWPTPTATLGNKGGSVTPPKGRKCGNLIEALALHLWPAPAAHDSDAPDALSGTPHSFAVRFPTPMTTDATGPSPGRYRRQSPQLCCHADGGPLNPAWVEWLMCWPIGWSDLTPLDSARFDAWLCGNEVCDGLEPDPWFAIDPANLDADAPGYVPRMAPGPG
jgi:hypothetical protein